MDTATPVWVAPVWVARPDQREGRGELFFASPIGADVT